MRIKLWVEDVDTGEMLEELGTCLTDNPGRAVQMYSQDEAWTEKGYNADIRWKDITNKAAAALGSIKSERKAASSRANGQMGGRPREIRTKRIEQSIEQGLYVTTDAGVIVAANQIEMQLSDDGVTGGEYVLSYHQGEMPAHKSETFESLDGLIAAMREVEPDLRKWRLGV